MTRGIEFIHVGEILPVSMPDRKWLAAHTGVRDITVFLPSTSRLRMQHVQEVVEEYGLPATAKTVNGPAPEEGFTTGARAAHKTMHVVDILLHDGHIERNPDNLTFVVAVDSRNIIYLHGQPPAYRDKPQSLELFGQYYVEWDRIAMQEGVLIANSAYAITAIRGGEIFQATVDDFVTLQPQNRQAVARAFLPQEDRFFANRGNAHGFTTAACIRDGSLAVMNVDGKVITGQSAVDRVYGASKPMIGSLFDSALASFVK